MPFQAEVLDRADAERWRPRRGPRCLEVDRLAVDHHRLDRAERDRRRRPNSTLSGATKMCRCLEFSTKIRNTSITPMCSSRPSPRAPQGAVASPAAACRRRYETKAPCRSGRLPSACRATAPRNRNSVQMTLKIMNSVSQAPPRCEPEEPGLAAEPLGGVLEPDDRERDDAEAGHHRDEVLQEAEHGPVAEDRDASATPGRADQRRRTPRGRPWPG